MRPYIYETIYNKVINEAAYAKQDVSAGHDSLEETSFLSLKSGSSFNQSGRADHCRRVGMMKKYKKYITER